MKNFFGVLAVVGLVNACGGSKEVAFVTRITAKRCALAYDSTMTDIRQKVDLKFYVGLDQGDCNQIGDAQPVGELGAAALFSDRNYNDVEGQKCLAEIEKLTVDDLKKAVQLAYTGTNDDDVNARTLLGYAMTLKPITDQGACVPEKVFTLGMPGQPCYISTVAPLKNLTTQANLDKDAADANKAPGIFCGGQSRSFIATYF